MFDLPEVVEPVDLPVEAKPSALQRFKESTVGVYIGKRKQAIQDWFFAFYYVQKVVGFLNWISTKYSRSYYVIIRGLLYSFAVIVGLLMMYIMNALAVGQVPQATMKVKIHEVRGVTLVTAFQRLIQEQLDNPWLANDLIWKSSPLDDMPSFQFGQLRAWTVFASKLQSKLSTNKTSGGDLGYLQAVVKSLNNDPHVMLMPDFRTHMRSAIENLEEYKRELVGSKVQFMPIETNLRLLLVDFTADLILFENRLTNASIDSDFIPSEEAEGDFVADSNPLYVNLEANFMHADDLLYYSQGYAYAVHVIMQAIQHEFLDVLKSRKSVDLMKNAIFYFEHAIYVDPPIVMNCGPNSVCPNHLANFNAPFSKARQKLDDIIGNIPMKK